MSTYGTRRATNKVYLNVYDLASVNDCLHPIGLGMYHTGIEVLGFEYTFAAEAGIFHHTPKDIPQATFREQIYMGEFDGGHIELKIAIDDIGGDEFGPNDYHLLTRNCNHFANALCMKLVRRPAPAYINRLAGIGNCLFFMVPKQFFQVAPVENSADYQSVPFLMKTPLNRGGPVSLPKSTIAFSGAGTVLGGGGRGNNGSISSSQMATTSTATVNDSLTDRREKARAAALARLELNSNNIKSVGNIGSDKSM